MNEIEISNALTSLITLSFAFIFFYWVWQQYIIDSTRQKLFELRDLLFDLASQDKIDRKSETYVVIRSMFNTNIRFAHELDWIHLSLFSFMVLRKKTEITKQASKVTSLIQEISAPETRDQVAEIFYQMHKTIALHVIRRSLVLLILLPVLLFLTESIAATKRNFSRFSKLIDAKAYTEVTSH